MIVALFFTRNLSLVDWHSRGLLDREKMVYERLLTKKVVSKVLWFTYGSDDAKLAAQLHNCGDLSLCIDVIPMPRLFNGRIRRELYSLFMPFIYRRIFKNVDLLKTNQMEGSWAAVIAKWLSGKPLLLRSGFILSQSHAHLKTTRLRKFAYRCMERFAYAFADHASVTSEHNKEYLAQKYGVKQNRISIVPNAIDIARFCPQERLSENKRWLYVGRFAPEKNLDNLIRACVEANMALDLCGAGEKEEDLQNLAQCLDADCQFLGVRPNNEVSELLKQYRYFIQPSIYEGMPKTLLEAMACGLVCVGTNVQGINEVLQDGINGFLANGTDAGAIAEAMRRAQSSNASLLCKAASESIRNRFSLDSVARCEEDAYKHVRAGSGV